VGRKKFVRRVKRPVGKRGGWMLKRARGLKVGDRGVVVKGSRASGSYKLKGGPVAKRERFSNHLELNFLSLVGTSE